MVSGPKDASKLHNLRGYNWCTSPQKPWLASSYGAVMQKHSQQILSELAEDFLKL